MKNSVPSSAHMKVLDKTVVQARTIEEQKRTITNLRNALMAVRDWKRLNPPQWQTNVPANEFIELREAVCFALTMPVPE